MVASGMAADIAALLSSTSARTLTVGLDKSGRVLQHDRAAGEVLAEVPASLLGTDFGTLVTGSAYGSGLQALIDAASSDRESTAVLTIKTGNGHHADAVVTVQPMPLHRPATWPLWLVHAHRPCRAKSGSSTRR